LPFVVSLSNADGVAFVSTANDPTTRSPATGAGELRLTAGVVVALLARFVAPVRSPWTPLKVSAYATFWATAFDSVIVIVPPDASSVVTGAAMIAPDTPAAAVVLRARCAWVVYVLPAESVAVKVGVVPLLLSVDTRTTISWPTVAVVVVVMTSEVPLAVLVAVPIRAPAVIAMSARLPGRHEISRRSS
jgi:hypothetical protein